MNGNKNELAASAAWERVLLDALESQKRGRLASSKKLKADDRLDEANMEKIRANVYDIAAAVIRTAGKTAPDDPVKFVKEKLSSIPNAWKEALAEADRRGEYEKVMTERVKLETMDEILTNI